MVQFSKSARRATLARRADLAVRARWKVQKKSQKNPKKMPKIKKIAFFGPKNHLLKVSSATWTGVFRPPPVECLRSENLLTLICVGAWGRLVKVRRTGVSRLEIDFFFFFFFLFQFMVFFWGLFFSHPSSTFYDFFS